ncbi:MAG: deoxynucleoside kinase [Bacteroidota bacterium]|jgi:deoxyadenosine/deoxycytidine kinase|nr:deoxynucleoside kinase [Bacteroidota bacterium]
MFIAIAGNIGSGKSSLTSLLHQKFGWVPHFESVDDNPYLPDFYADMTRWSFHLQVYFLSKRFILHRTISEGDESVVQDRSIYEDAEIFALNLHRIGRMDDRDYENYRALYEAMTAYLQPPQLLIYLRAGIPTLQRQIRLRGRDFEQNIEVSYLEQLNALYEEWIGRYSLGPLLVIDSDETDFVHDMQKQEDVLYRITHAIRNTRG